MEELATQVRARLHPVEAVMERLCLSRSTVFTLISDGRLRSVKVGRRRLVTEQALVDFVSALDATAGMG